MKKFKEYLIAFIAGIGTLAGIIMVFLSLKDSDADQTIEADDTLAEQENALDEEIQGLEDELDNPVEDLDAEGVEEYWSDL